MVIYSILLFLSRLVPAFQLVDSSNLTEEAKEEEKQSLMVAREQSIQEYVGLIKQYSQSGTYFVRKMVAQALLPIQRFEDYVEEIKSSLGLYNDIFNRKVEMRQNEVHGHLIRVHTYLQAYFRYRELNQQISGRSSEEEAALRKEQEQAIAASFHQIVLSFQSIGPGRKDHAKAIINLWMKCLRCLLKNTQHYPQDQLKSMAEFFAEHLTQNLKPFVEMAKEGNFEMS